jgi:molybdenum cofactor cytidylyltransferase
MQLITALRYSQVTNMVFVGAGGKTSAIFCSARELLAANRENWIIKTVVVTTTTHFGSWQANLADHCSIIQSYPDLQRLEDDLPVGVVLICSGEKNDRLTGLNPDLLQRLDCFTAAHRIPLLIEADGAHQLPLKAPAAHEPNIPAFAQTVIVTAGLSGLGKPLTEEWVHRHERFCELSCLHPGGAITGDGLVKVLLNTEGGLKNIPSEARRIVLLNQVDTPELQSMAQNISRDLLAAYHSIIISSVSMNNPKNNSSNALIRGTRATIHGVIEPIAGIILAAGGSSRFGEPKQLLKWKGEPIIRHVAMSALKAGLSPVVVVLGNASAMVRPVIEDLPLRIAINERWMEGKSESIRNGLAGIHEEVGGTIFMQADQPQIPPRLIRSLVEAHQTSLGPIVAPLIDGQRGNPVLFDALTFPDLGNIMGDTGGRELYSRYPVQWVTWHDPNILLDIDSPEDYQNFLTIYPDNGVSE